MFDRDDLVELAPHYVVMLVLVLLVLALLRAIFGESRFVIQFAVVLVLVTLYPFVVRRLGVAPSMWE